MIFSYFSYLNSQIVFHFTKYNFTFCSIDSIFRNGFLQLCKFALLEPACLWPILLKK